MATRSLVVELDAKTKKLDAKLSKTGDGFDDLGRKAKSTDSSFRSMSGAAGLVGKGVLAVGAAATTATITMIALSKAVGEYSKEIKIAANLSGVAVEELQLMAHATATVGIGIEQLGDISKDTREKIGDFLNTGGGGFMDFVDAMKLTKKEAREVAVEFSKMSGPAILQEMVSRMEDANVSAVQMSHALEGMASDTTKLIPLLADSGAELNKLSDAAARVTIPLSDEDIDLFIRMGTSTDIAAAALKSLGEQTLLSLGESFIKAAEAAAFFFAALNEGTEAQKTKRLADIAEEIEQIQENYEHLDNWFNRAISSEAGFQQQQAEGAEKVNALLKERAQLQEDLAKSRFGIGEDSSDGAGGGAGEVIPGSVKSADDNASAIQAIKDRFKSEEELLTEKFERELEMIGENNELKLQLENEYVDALFEITEASDARVADAAARAEKKRVKQAKKDNKDELKDKKNMELQKLNNQEAAIGLGKALNESLLGDNKAVAAGLIIADTAVGISKSLSISPYDYVNVGIIAATGALNLANALGASKGGGSISTGASGGGSGAPPVASQPDFQQETTGLEFTDSEAGGSQTNTINFGTDSGDDLIDAIAAALNKAQVEGRT